MNRLSIVDMLCGLCVALVWGMGVVFAKAAIDEFPPILLMGFRFLVTALALVWFVRPPIHQLSKLFWIAFISAAIQYSLTFTGLLGVDASVAVLVVQLEVPFLVILGALTLNEKPGRRKWIGIALAFAGVALIAGEPKLGTAWLSLLLVIGGAFSWAVGQVMVRTLKSVDGLTVTAWVAVFATPQLFMMSFIFEGDHWQAIESASWVVWSAILYMGLIMTALGYWLWYSLVRKHPVSLIAPFLLMLPVFSIFGGVVFLGEQLTLQIAAGGTIVIAGVAFILFERAPKPAAAVEEA
jgi:O-acetylserine/cysteine efflux transporter